MSHLHMSAAPTCQSHACALPEPRDNGVRSAIIRLYCNRLPSLFCAPPDPILRMSEHACLIYLSTMKSYSTARHLCGLQPPGCYTQSGMDVRPRPHANIASGAAHQSQHPRHEQYDQDCASRDGRAVGLLLLFVVAVTRHVACCSAMPPHPAISAMLL